MKGSRRFQDKCDPSNAVTMAEIATKDGGCYKPEGDAQSELLTFHTWERCHKNNDCWTKQKAFHTSLIMKAFMVTQNLHRSRYIYWLPPEDYEIFLGRKDELSFILEMTPYVTVLPFYYAEEIKKTPINKSHQISNMSYLYTLPHFSSAYEADIIRLVILHNYGGVWIDNDAVPLIDLYNFFAGVGLQFIGSFNNNAGYNNHVMFLYKKSKLAVRRLETMLSLPFDKPQLWPVSVQHALQFGGVSSKWMDI